MPTQQWNLTISQSLLGHTAFVNIPFRKVSQCFLKRDFREVSTTINKLNTCWAFQRLWNLQDEKKGSRQKDQHSLNDLASHWKIQVPVAKLLSINLKPLRPATTSVLLSLTIPPKMAWNLCGNDSTKKHVGPKSGFSSFSSRTITGFYWCSLIYGKYQLMFWKLFAPRYNLTNPGILTVLLYDFRGVISCEMKVTSL